MRRTSRRDNGELQSPFHHLMAQQRPLTPREVLHRRRMLHVLVSVQRLTRVSTASEYKVKSFPGAASSNRSTKESGPVMR